MRTGTKVWLIIAAALVLLGVILFAGVMTTLGWDFEKLSTVHYETNTYEISEEFHNISLNTDTAHIVFALSDDGTCVVECYEEENARHSVAVENGTLTIEVMDEKSAFDHLHFIGINIGAPKLTVYLPEAVYTSLCVHESTGNIEVPQDFSFADVDISLSTGNVSFSASASQTVKIKASTGNILVENTSAGNLDLTVSTGLIAVSHVICEGDIRTQVSTGRTSLRHVTCSNLTSGGDTGDLLLEDVVSAERISVERSTGDVKFESCDAAEIYMETDTGDITGTLLSGKIFEVSTDTGKVDVPKSTTGGICEIKTDTGDIRLTIQNETDPS